MRPLWEPTPPTHPDLARLVTACFFGACLGGALLTLAACAAYGWWTS